MNKIYAFGFFSSIMFERVLWMIYLKSIGWTVLEISFAQAVLTLSQVIFEIPSGYIADKFSRKTSLIMGQVCVILYITSYFFAKYHYIFIIGFIIYGLGLSLISGADQSLVYESSDKKYAKVMGRYNAIVMSAFLISISFGGILSEISWNILFSFTMLFQVISLLILFGIKEKQKDDKSLVDGKSLLQNILSILSTDKSFKYLIFTIVVLQSSFSILYQYVSLLLNDYGINNNSISIVSMISYLITIIAAVNLYKLIERFNRNKLVGVLLIIHLFILMLLISNIGVIIVFVVIMNKLLYELWDTILNTKVHDELDDSFRSSMISFINLSTAAIMTVESVLIGIVSNILSIQQIFFITGILSICFALFFYKKYVKLQQI